MFRVRASLISAGVFACLGFSHTALADQLNGFVKTGSSPIVDSTVVLYVAGASRADTAIELGYAKTDRLGAFRIRYTAPYGSSPVLYVVADGGSAYYEPERKDIRLASVLGTGTAPKSVVINERTTVATAYAMAQFLKGYSIAGSSPGLQNAAATLRNLVDIATGEVSPVLASKPNGNQTSTMREFNTLSNILAACTVFRTECPKLFSAAAAPDGSKPHTTLDAALNIAHYPGHNPAGLFAFASVNVAYEPALAAAPDAWTVAIRYWGNGQELDGPGTMAIDAEGNVYITVNYEYTRSPKKQVCGGLLLSKLTPAGEDAFGAPFYGGGLYGAGFGITLDANNNVWVGNFGFEGTGDQTCTGNNKTVSAFSADGVPQSQDGFHNGKINQAQGMAQDQHGNIWIANCAGNSITEYPGADPYRAKNFTDAAISEPFGLAVDANGHIWFANNGNDSITELAPDGSVAGNYTASGLRAPLGVAVDSENNIWTANSQLIPIPCEAQKSFDLPLRGKPSISRITKTAKGSKVTTFKGGGLTIPWGIAVDGNDNVWVANFAQKRLSEFCGIHTENCPPGLNTGDPISPDTGYTSDTLQRNTGVVIDQSGNVWVANNWLELAIQANPGGREVVEFVGAAGPVKTPMVGPPRQP